jgi:hypothetical protein
MSKIKKFLIVLVGCLFVGGSTALALEASDFYQEAASWSYQNCQTVGSSRLNNTICFLLKNQSDNQIRWALQKDNNAAQQTAINSLQTSSISKSRTYKTTSTIVVSQIYTQEAEAFCNDSNDVLLSGGYIGTADKKLHISGSGAGDESTGISSWVIAGFGEEPNGYTFQAFANCYSVD